MRRENKKFLFEKGTTMKPTYEELEKQLKEAQENGTRAFACALSLMFDKVQVKELSPRRLVQVAKIIKVVEVYFNPLLDKKIEKFN